MYPEFWCFSDTQEAHPLSPLSSFKSESLSVYFNRITYLFTLATFEVVGLTGHLA